MSYTQEDLDKMVRKAKQREEKEKRRVTPKRDPEFLVVGIGLCDPGHFDPINENPTKIVTNIKKALEFLSTARSDLIGYWDEDFHIGVELTPHLRTALPDEMKKDLFGPKQTHDISQDLEAHVSPVVLSGRIVMVNLPPRARTARFIAAGKVEPTVAGVLKAAYGDATWIPDFCRAVSRTNVMDLQRRRNG